MILILASLLLADLEPAQTDTIHCELAGQGFSGAGGGPVRLLAECPDAPGLQDAADAALELVDLGAYAQAAAETEIARTIEFSYDGATWIPRPGQVILNPSPAFPARAAQYGATHMVCALAFDPDSAGVPQDVRARCLSDNGRAERIMEHAARRDAARWRLLPSALPYCLEEQIHLTAAIYHRGRRQPSGPMPDPASLPLLCDTTD